METWTAIIALIGILAAIVERLRAKRIEDEISTRLERDRLQREAVNRREADEITTAVVASDLAALRERMRKYQRPDG